MYQNELIKLITGGYSRQQIFDYFRIRHGLGVPMTEHLLRERGVQFGDANTLARMRKEYLQNLSLIDN